MGIQSRNSFKKLCYRLYNTQGHDFQHLCWEFLTYARPGLQYARDLREHDCAGVDLFDFGELIETQSELDYELVVQCKGVEGQAFTDRHIANTIASIRKFGRSGRRTAEYWLVLNRPTLNTTHATQIEAELSLLVTQGAAKATKLLNPQAMLNEIFQELTTRIISRLAEKNQQQLDRFTALLQEDHVYIADVPCELQLEYGTASGASGTDPRNPLQLLQQTVITAPRKSSSVRFRSRPYHLIVAEFGFGKTALLLELARTLGTAGKTVLFQPVIEMDKTGFDNELELVRHLYKSLWPEEEDQTDSTYPPLMAFREVLRYDANCVLILDGLDEHRYFYTSKGLQCIFGTLRELSCEVVISMRKEFFDAMQGNLALALREAHSGYLFCGLKEWDQGPIVAFLQSYASTPHINDLIGHVEGKEYEGLFGDIPRRPLFLRMLADDLLAGINCAGDLAELYRRYFSRKVDRDLSTPFDRSADGGRPLPVEELDVLDLKGRLLRLMEELAVRNLVPLVESPQLAFRESLEESELLSLAETVGLSGVQALPLLLHSILVSISPRTEFAPFRMRFAHSSFQEYFAAAGLIRLAHPWLASPALLPPNVRRFVQLISHQ